MALYNYGLLSAGTPRRKLHFFVRIRQHQPASHRLELHIPDNQVVRPARPGRGISPRKYSLLCSAWRSIARYSSGVNIRIRHFPFSEYIHGYPSRISLACARALSICTNSPLPIPGQYRAVFRHSRRLSTSSGQNGNTRHWVGFAG